MGVAKLRVQPSGEVSEVAEGEPRFVDLGVTRCVLAVYRTMRLPPEPSPSRRTREHGPRSSSDFVYALHFEAAEVPAASAAR